MNFSLSTENISAWREGHGMISYLISDAAVQDRALRRSFLILK